MTILDAQTDSASVDTHYVADAETHTQPPHELRSQILEAALGYARLGWSVIPIHSIREGGGCSCRDAMCASAGKHPVGKWKRRQTDRMTEPELVDQWTRTPWANVGIVTGSISKLVVLDIDDPKKLEGQTDLLHAITGLNTPVAVTGRDGGGFHIYLSYSEDRPLRNFAGEGIDGRGDGGYVVAPPSNHKSGKSYAWAPDGCDANAPLADMPDAVLALFEGRHANPSLLPDNAPLEVYARNSLDAELAGVAASHEGRRNDTLNRAAFNLGRLVWEGKIEADLVKSELQKVANASGLPEQEARATIASGMTAGAAKARGTIDLSSTSASTIQSQTNAQRENTPLPIEYFCDIKASLQNVWLVRNLIPQAGLVLFYGSPGSGKSFLAADICVRIAAGMDVDGRAVKQCPTVYVAAEGQAGFRRRVVAFREHHKIAHDTPFALVPTAVDLLSPDADMPRLIAAIEGAAEIFGGHPGLIVVDTLAATFGGGDENGKDMVAYVNNLARLRDQFGAAVIAVHHRPKDVTNNTPRGHGSLAGAMDTILCVEKGAMHSATITKQKDSEGGDPLHFGLVTVLLGEDEEQEPVNSAIVKYSRFKASKKLSGQQKEALDMLAELIQREGSVCEETAMANYRGPCVPVYVWREKWVQVDDDGDMKTETLQKSFKRAKEGLLRAEKIAEGAGRVWLVPESDPNATGTVMDFDPMAPKN